MGVIKTFEDGDTEVARWDADDEAQVKMAEEVFAALKLDHALIDTSDPQVIKPKMEAFDPLAEQIFAVPQLAGG